jgi:transposase
VPPARVCDHARPVGGRTADDSPFWKRSACPGRSGAIRRTRHAVTGVTLRRRQIKHTIPEPRDQRANRRRRGSRGGRPTGFDKTAYRRRNEVERTINRLKNFRAIATRYDKRVYVFHGTVTVASIRLRPRPA